MSLILDAGALIAIERARRDVHVTLAAARRHQEDLRTSAIVLGQVWRTGRGSQTALARLLPSLDVVPVDADMGRAAGVLLGLTGMSDPIDATIALIAGPDDRILTSDPTDITRLLGAAGSTAAVSPC